MVLVKEVLDVDVTGMKTRCRCSVPLGSPILDDGQVPQMLVVEMLAQSAACLKGYVELLRGTPVRPAYLVRIDGLDLGRPPMPGEDVIVVATEQRGFGDYFVYHAQARTDQCTLACGSLGFVVEDRS